MIKKCVQNKHQVKLTEKSAIYVFHLKNVFTLQITSIWMG